jgi:hypothetical protein
VATKTVKLTFGPGGIDADPDLIEVDVEEDTVCWEVTAEPTDVVTLDLQERVKRGKTVKGPFKKHASQTKRGVFKQVGSGKCMSATCDQVPARAASELWKYDVIWQKGKTLARLDPAIKIVV